MEMELKYGQMEENMKEVTNSIKKMVMELWNGVMEKDMRVIG
mgnify:CR=1 FL=1